MDIQAVFIDIIKENEGLILKVVKVYANTKADEQDLYQEIIYQLWKSFPSFRAEAKISTWMYRIALNTSTGYLHKEKRKGSYLPIDGLLINSTLANDNIREEQVAILYGHIRQLNAAEKGIILLYLDDRPYEEIAAITGFTVTNIGTRLGRIKQKIKDQIKK